MAARQTALPDLTKIPQYINEGDWLTLAQLKAAYPAGPAQLGRLARVLDVWETVRTTLICEYDGNRYYWRPQRTDYAQSSAQRTGTINLIPLITAPKIVMTASLLGSMNLALSEQDVWPGCSYEVTAPPTLGLFSLMFTGLVGGLTSGLLAGNRKVATYTAEGWRVS